MAAMLLLTCLPLQVLADYPPSHSFGDGVPLTFKLEGEAARGKPGQTISVPIAIFLKQFYEDNSEGDYDIVDINLYSSNINGRRRAYDASRSWEDYDKDITEWFNEISLSIDTTGEAELPFLIEELDLTESVVDQVKNGSDTITRNHGFAVFKIKLKSSGLENGNYNIPITAHWRDYRNRQDSFTSFIPIIVTGANSGSGGGGGIGGGGGGGEEAKSQAKLLVESIDTDPKEPKAGEAFDVLLTLRNTSVNFYLQNIKLTYTAEEDAILPAAGSSTVYIPKIEKDDVFPLRLPVKSSAEMDDKPVKMEISLEFEDNKLNALTETQTMILNVTQPQRIQVDDPVLPATIPVVGDSYEFTVDVFNLGKPMLYNVTARVVTDDENLIPGQSAYGGNMESGTSKTCEMEIFPMEAGSYNATVVVSYENAAGEAQEVKKELSFAVMAEEEEPEEYEFEPEPTEAPKPTALTIMAALPWWLYVCLAALLVSMFMYFGIRARRRRKRAMFDDEMD